MISFPFVQFCFCLLLFCSYSFAQNITVRWIQNWNCELDFLGKTLPCVLGVNGAGNDTKEGDGRTPFGQFKLRRAFYRADKTNSLDCFNASKYLNCEAIQPNYGWVDEPLDPLYNQFVYLPYPASHEELYLTSSSAYDLMAVIGYNDDPIVPYAGSAIFFHVTTTYGGTAGCVAISMDDLKWVLSQVSAESWIIITQ